MDLSAKEGSVTPQVAIIMGSKTDAKYLVDAKEVLEALEIPYQARVISAHRAPAECADFAKNAKTNGFKVIIAGAGAAAALPGAMASHTSLPVIGVPLDTTSLGGLDALLSICQMPGGIPVACMGIGKAGAKNAALLAGRLLSLCHPQIGQRLERFIEAQKITAIQKIEEDPFS